MRGREPVWGPYRSLRRHRRYRLRHPGRLAVVLGLVLLLVLAGEARGPLRPFTDLVANRASPDSGEAAAARRAQIRLRQKSDFNRNGLPDNLDILDGAYRGLMQRPRFDERYVPLSYPGGDVPADQTGRADVVVRALREAGYDLQQLVNQDIKGELARAGGAGAAGATGAGAVAAAYPLETKWHQAEPDASIDHRRVPNLLTYLQRHAYPQTLVIRGHEDEWWPGDIVVFAQTGEEPDHIGIVSDRLGRGGVPRVIEASPGLGVTQTHSLLAWPVVGHFRIAR